MLPEILAVATGSALGGSFRFLISKALNPLFLLFPAGTFLVNISGCFILGFLNGITDRQNIFTPEIRLLFTTGFCGSFTTFSTFLYESSTLLSQGKFYFLLYLFTSLATGFFAVYAGSFLANKIL